MPNNQYKILITKPCTKNWDAMQPTDVGRHCNSCKKEVIDFSVLSDDEVKNYLIKNIGKETCGRFYHHQIDRIKIVLPQHILHSNIPRWKKFLVVFMICFGVQLFSIDVSLAQTQQSIDSLPVLDSMIQGDTVRILDNTEISDTTKQNITKAELQKQREALLKEIDSLNEELRLNQELKRSIVFSSGGVCIKPVEFEVPFVYGFTQTVPEQPRVENRCEIMGTFAPPSLQPTLDTSPFLNPPKNKTSKKPKIPNKNLPLNNPSFLPEEIFTLNKRKKK